MRGSCGLCQCNDRSLSQESTNALAPISAPARPPRRSAYDSLSRERERIGERAFRLRRKISISCLTLVISACSSCRDRIGDDREWQYQLERMVEQGKRAEPLVPCCRCLVLRVDSE